MRITGPYSDDTWDWLTRPAYESDTLDKRDRRSYKVAREKLLKYFARKRWQRQAPVLDT